MSRGSFVVSATPDRFRRLSKLRGGGVETKDKLLLTKKE